ncbi:MAG: hypothetical protein OEY06_13635 [Gammaproteobacteria bacterium]|nr:hypothetical protein [Gammaproteobacteria bacterium]
MSKITLIIIILVAVGGYKYFSSSIGFNTTQEDTLSNKVVSSPYKFQASFHKEPTLHTTTAKIPVLGRLKNTTYVARDNDFTCTVGVSDYLDVTESIGSLNDVIESSKNATIRKLGGEITNSRYIRQDGIKGYEYTLLSKSAWFYKSRVFMKFNNLYVLSCLYRNNNQFDQKADDFLDSFFFI